MFNRPGGQSPVENMVPTYIFGPDTGEKMVTGTMWAAMRAVWDDCGYNGWGLADYNDDTKDNQFGRPLRRGWFYTGGGLPLDNDATIRTDGRVNDRQVGPITGGVYKQYILDLWPQQDEPESEKERYRCLFLDAAAQFYGLFVAMVHTDAVNQAFTLVGEAVPTDDEARLAAPWFCFVRFQNSPWWNLNEDDRPVPDRDFGYNRSWESATNERTVYFGTIATSEYPDLRETTPPGPEAGDNLSLGDIYRWIHKGGVPVAWAGGYAKVGAAWDYASGRLLCSRYASNMRSIRGLRV